MDNTRELTQRKSFKMPSTLVLIFYFMVAAAVLTFVVPAGSYQTVGDSALIDPSSFTFVEQTPISIPDFFKSVYNGLQKGSGTIFLILLLGGFFQIINDTRAIDAGINAVAVKLKDKKLLIVPIFFVVIYILGSLHVLSNAAIVFMPIGIVLCKRLKLDPLVALGVIFLSSHAGFAVTPMGPFNTIVAQTIGGIPILSGFGLRSVVWAIILVVTLLYVYRYAKKISEDPSKSLVGVYEDVDEEIEQAGFDWKHGIILISMTIGFGGFAYGAYKFGWGIDVMSGIMFVLALIAGIVGGSTPDKMAKSFTEGVKSVTLSAMIVGFASAIQVIMNSGQIIHTLIYYATIPLAYLSKSFASILMFVINLLFNAAVPSASGQAYITMPIMAPMSDVLGISRQVAALVVQYGSGMSDIIIPTGGTTMGCIALAGLSYDQWFKWVIKLFGIWVLIACVTIVIAVAIGWS